MGHKDEWCHPDGCKARIKGMAKKESRGKQICIGVFFGICAIICFVIGAISSTRASNAAKVNADFEYFGTLNFDTEAYLATQDTFGIKVLADDGSS